MDAESVFGDTPLELGERASLGSAAVSGEDEETGDKTYEGGRGYKYLGSGSPNTSSSWH